MKDWHSLLGLVLVGMFSTVARGDSLPAFPGAVGQGAAATGGRGGDVYHVTSLQDYAPHKDEPKIQGTLRHAIRSAEAPRTIVFDVSGAIELHEELHIEKNDLTIAGQTSPQGVTIWGYPTDISESKNLIIRHLRFRTGDFNAEGAPERKGIRGNGDLEASSANGISISGGSERIILDHVSAAWGMDETLSVTISRDVTIQNCIIAESLNHSFHAKGDHGYGSLIRGELTPEDQAKNVGGYTLYGNLWSSHRARNPSIAGQQRLASGKQEQDRLRTDVNVVNNVIFNWGDQATHRSELGDVRINLIGNCYVIGPAKVSGSKYFFRENTEGRTEMYQQGNWLDADRDGDEDGNLVTAPEQIKKGIVDFGADDNLVSEGAPLPFLGNLASHLLSAEQAYETVVATVGASLHRDPIDQRIIERLKSRTGKLLNSQEEFRSAEGKLPGIDDIPSDKRAADFDTDGDGLPNTFEMSHGLDPNDATDANRTTLDKTGYTNLEVYLNELAAAPVK